MKNKDLEFKELFDTSWTIDVIFLIDITHDLHSLNLLLQGRNRIATQLYDHVSAFETQLWLWANQISNKNCAHFPSLEIIVKNYEFMSRPSYIEYVTVIPCLRNEISREI